MLQLGYSQYVTQAGDWGFWITRALGRLYPESCKASHLNMILAKSPEGKEAMEVLADPSQKISAEDKEGLERTKWFEVEGRGKGLAETRHHLR